MRKFRKRKLFFIAFWLLMGLIAWQFELVSYGIGQARGQFNVLWEARPMDEVLADKDFSDSLKQKLILIQQIKKFAEDSLGLKKSENYTSVYDQKGKAILWVLTASKPYELEAEEWDFPFFGSFPYKGFFELEKAKIEEVELQKKGLDTDVDEVNAWSTLGWFRDPVLSSMLRRSEGSLASLIIHELTHGTLYVKDSVVYNENLANFIGDQGALRFLESRFGKNSAPLQKYVEQKADIQTFRNFVLKASWSLDSVYRNFDKKMPDSLKAVAKKKHIELIISSMDTLTFYNKGYCLYFEDFKPNNTFFMEYKRYNERRNLFEDQFYKEFGGNFPKYFEYLKSKYSSL
jgi:predicted aminopeptidase